MELRRGRENHASGKCGVRASAPGTPPISLIYVIVITGWCHRYKSMERCRRPLSKQTHPPPQMSSPSHIPSSGPNDSILTYPPTARVKIDKQPTAKTEMSPRPGQETGVERLRGGCIPCPVRSAANAPFIVRCSFLTISPDRTADAASAFPSPVVDRTDAMQYAPQYSLPLTITDFRYAQRTRLLRTYDCFVNLNVSNAVINIRQG